MNDEELLSAATAAGFPILTDPSYPVDLTAARLLPAESPAVGVALAGDVLMAVASEVPSPAEFHDLERACGLSLALYIAPGDVFRSIRERSHEGATGDAPRSVGPALAAAVERGASDVHLSVGSPPMLRAGGALVPLERFPVLSATDLEHTARWILGDRLESFTGDHDAAITYAGARWRVSLYRQRKSLALALRRITSEIPRLEQLGLPSSVVSLANISQGLILFCGPTGSGKSTSMAALVDRINRTKRCHILTIEDPVEYIHQSHMATVHQREVGDDTPTFATGLRAAMRQDPDVILVGELRDLETMQTALAAAETGHLVLATVHASSTGGVFNRIIDGFPAAQQDMVRTQLATSLRAVVAQILLPAAQQGERQLVTEILICNNAVRALVREDRLHELGSVLESGVGEGMSSMDRSLATLVAAGRLTAETGSMWMRDPKTYEEHLRRSGGAKVNAQAFAGLDDLDLDSLSR